MGFFKSSDFNCCGDAHNCLLDLLQHGHGCIAAWSSQCRSLAHCIAIIVSIANCIAGVILYNSSA